MAKTYRDYSDEELERMQEENPVHSDNHLGAFHELTRRQLLKIATPHWSVVPGFYLLCLSVLSGLIAIAVALFFH